jgi:hypothetical protein
MTLPRLKSRVRISCPAPENGRFAKANRPCPFPSRVVNSASSNRAQSGPTWQHDTRARPPGVYLNGSARVFDDVTKARHATKSAKHLVSLVVRPCRNLAAPSVGSRYIDGMRRDAHGRLEDENAVVVLVDQLLLPPEVRIRHHKRLNVMFRGDE